jgi:hypothetical protein
LRLITRLKTTFAVLAVVALCGSLIAPSFAGAQSTDPTQSEYNDTLTQINTGSNAPTQDTGASGLGGNVGPLPFTGFDVIAMAAVALAVTGLGLALQRAVSRDPSDELGS